ncbi:MAG: hypothetical protein H6Q99_4131 [Proteobacteria bacterium]|nr:hypothetical protein [Pseudomonadota bacterium]
MRGGRCRLPIPCRRLAPDTRRQGGGRPIGCDVVALDGVVGQHRQQVAARQEGRGDEVGADADAAAGHQRRHQRFAGVHHDAGGRDDLDVAIADAERPAQHLAAALIAQVDGVVLCEVVRVSRRAARGEIGGARKAAEPMRRQPARQQPRVRKVADPHGDIDARLDDVDELVAEAQVDHHLGVERPERRQHRRDHVDADRQRRGNPEGARRLRAGRLRHLFDLLGIAQQPERPLVQVAPFGGERQRAGGARDQRQAERLLQPLNALADRRRRNRQRSGGGGEAAQRSDAGEGDQAG